MKILLILLTFTYIFAAPAFNKTREFTQADGTTFTAKANGDSYLNWTITLDGDILKYNSISNNFEHAIIQGDKLVASGNKYVKSNLKKANSLLKDNKIKIDDVYKLWKKKRENKH